MPTTRILEAAQETSEGGGEEVEAEGEGRGGGGRSQDNGEETRGRGKGEGREGPSSPNTRSARVTGLQLAHGEDEVRAQCH